MGFARERPGVDGAVRYAAIYRDLKGRQRSAGTFATERQADKAWQRAEAAIGLGRSGIRAAGGKPSSVTWQRPGCRTMRSRPAPASGTRTPCTGTSCRSSGRCG